MLKSIKVPIDPLSLFRVVQVDDFNLWQKFVIEQMQEVDRRQIINNCEYGGNHWVYRGQMDAELPITSTFEREMSKMDGRVKGFERSLRGREQASIREFKRLAWRYVNDASMDDLEWVTLMRHHGVPTRLVDFSENAMVALYFALESKVETDFAVWAINRDALSDSFSQSQIGRRIPCLQRVMEKFGTRANEVLNDPDTTDADVLATQEYLLNFQNSDATQLLKSQTNRKRALEILTASLAGKEEQKDGNPPALYFYPEKPSPRMIAQRGLFLMPTQISKPFMQSLYEGLEIDESINGQEVKMSELRHGNFQLHVTKMYKFVFKRSIAREVGDWLRLANFTKDRLFPDLEGVAGAVTESVKRSLSQVINIDHLIPEKIRKQILGCSGGET